MNDLEKEQYLKELELIAKTRRDKANLPTHSMTIMPNLNPYPFENTAIIDGNELYKDLQKRRRERTCSRCGFYYEYHIDSSQQTFKVAGYNGPEIFFREFFTLRTETVKNPGTLDDDFYDVCKKCQKEMLEGFTNEFTDLREIRKKLKHYREQEDRRLERQNKLVDQITKDLAKKKRDKYDERLEKAEANAEAQQESTI